MTPRFFEIKKHIITNQITTDIKPKKQKQQQDLTHQSIMNKKHTPNRPIHKNVNFTSGLSSLSRSEAIESSIIASTVRSAECSTQ